MSENQLFRETSDKAFWEHSDETHSSKKICISDKILTICSEEIAVKLIHRKFPWEFRQISYFHWNSSLNGRKFCEEQISQKLVWVRDITQITLRSDLLSQMRSSVVVLRDWIHKALGNLINIIRIVKLGCLMVKLQACEQVIARLIYWGLVLKWK